MVREAQMQTSATPETKLITGEELFAMVGAESCELIDGRMVPMSPTGGEHGGNEFTLGAMLWLFVRQKKLGYVVGGEVGIYIRRNPDTVRSADIAFFTKAQLPSGLPKGYIDSSPELVVEITSPGDGWEDLREKLEDYFSIGTSRVWLVEPKRRRVLVYRAPNDYTELSEADTLVGEGALDGFTLPVASIFQAD
jgi:Uma2 family endonuclease